MVREGTNVQPALRQRALAEFLGTHFLLVGVIGSGIMAQRLSDDVGLQLLQNAFATSGILAAIILAFGWISGAHFNPAVTLLARALDELDSTTAVAYLGAQLGGAISGALVANIMFDLPAVNLSTTERGSLNLLLGEVVATLGLLLIIWGVVRAGRADAAPYAVAAYIGGAYYFTSSTSFANPAVTVARTLSDTFAGIKPSSAPGFIVAQLLGTTLALVLIPVVFAHDPSPTRQGSRDR